jgi:hypothetical protein
VAAKKSAETEWKRAAIEKMIADERERAKPNVARIAKLKALKRRPGDLLIGADFLSDVDVGANRTKLLQIAHDLTARVEQLKRGTPEWHDAMRELGYVRLRLFPRGSERELAALKTERARIVERSGSVAAYRRKSRAQRSNAGGSRGASDKHGSRAVRELIYALARDPDHIDTRAGEMWQRMRTAIEEEFGPCSEESKPKRFVYPYYSKTKRKTVPKTLSFRQFRELWSGARALAKGKKRAE